VFCHRACRSFSDGGIDAPPPIQAAIGLTGESCSMDWQVVPEFA